MSHRSPSSAVVTRGFTLIELLVVIAIVAILAAILFPVFAQAKAAAYKAQSLSQLKGLALGATLYAHDFDDAFMPPRTLIAGRNYRYWWAGYDETTQKLTPQDGLLYPFTRSEALQADPLFPNRLRAATGMTGYGYNYRYLAARPTTDLARPAETVLFASSAQRNFVPPYTVQGNTYLDAPSARYPTFQARASGRGCVAWADGHASSREPRYRLDSPLNLPPETWREAGLGEIDADGDLTTDELFDGR